MPKETRPSLRLPAHRRRLELTPVRTSLLILWLGFASLLLGATAAAGRSGGAVVFVAPGGSDANPCSQPRPCASFGRAYRAAPPGGSVEIAAGTYGAQTVPADPSKAGSSGVVFRPAPGARVTAGRVTDRASDVTFQGMQFAWSLDPGADHVVLQQIVADDAVYITGATNVSVIGGQVYSPVPVVSDSQIATWSGSVPTNILIDGVAFHDWVDAGPTPTTHHIECLQIGAGVGVTIRNSSFRRCETHDLFIRSWGSSNGNTSPLRNFTIQSNVFAPTLVGYYSLRLAAQTGWPCANFMIVGNTALQNMFSDCAAAGVRFQGNTQPSMSPYSCAHLFGAVWIGNTFAAGVPCGSNRVVAGGSAPSASGTPPPAGGDGTGTGKPGDSTTASTVLPAVPETPVLAVPGSKPAPSAAAVAGGQATLHGRISAITPSSVTVGNDRFSLTCARSNAFPLPGDLAVGVIVVAACSATSGGDLLTIRRA